MTKSIEDITREQIITLVETAAELLGVARLYYWKTAGETCLDQSEREVMDSMENILADIGLPPCSYSEFKEHLESMLASGNFDHFRET